MDTPVIMCTPITIRESTYNEATKLEVCRICLVMDVKMYKFTQYELGDMYEEITGIVARDVRLPQYVCWECCARLTAAVKLRHKALQADALLHQLIEDGNNIQIQDIKSIGRFQNGLESTLTQLMTLEVIDNTMFTLQEVEVKTEDTEETNEVAKEDDLIEHREEIYILERNIKESNTINKEVDTVTKSEIIDFQVEINNLNSEQNSISNENIEFKDEIILLDSQELVVTNTKQDKTNNNSITLEFGEEVDDIDSQEHVISINDKENNSDSIEVANDDDNLNIEKDVVTKHEAEDLNGQEISKAKVKISNSKRKINDNKLKANNTELKISKPSEYSDLRKGSVMKQRKYESLECDISDESGEDISGDEGDYESSNITDVEEDEWIKEIEKLIEIQKKEKEERKIGMKRMNSSGYVKTTVKKAIKMGEYRTIFTITPLTYDQQIQEIRKRKDNARYLNEPFKCELCYRGFQNKSRYETHMIIHSEKSGSFECVICKRRQKTKKALRRHMMGFHAEKFECKKCNYVTKNSTTAKVHYQCHKGASFSCKYCYRQFKHTSTYQTHLRLHHGSDFICEFCGHPFLSQYGLRLHKNKKHYNEEHMTLNGPNCDTCNVKFVSEEAFKTHLMSSARHSLKPKHYRKTAKKSCEQKINTPADCEQCGKRLDSLRGYAIHMRRCHPVNTASNEAKIYNTTKPSSMCELCGKIFQSATLLKSHMWVHTGVKAYTCDICTKKFSQKQTLIYHMSTHTGREPIDCPICGKKFTHKGNRNRHMLMHTSTEVHQCKFCDKSFKCRETLRAHENHVHLKKPWPKRDRHRPKIVKSDSNTDSD